MGDKNGAALLFFFIYDRRPLGDNHRELLYSRLTCSAADYRCPPT
jgi:hypothetical protein